MDTNVAIIGAGVTGLCCSCYLNQDHFVFEKNDEPGGVCRTLNINGYKFDFGEHFMRVPNNEVNQFLTDILGDRLFSQNLNAQIFFEGKAIPYPFQKNLYYLSNENKKKALLGFLQRDKYSQLDDSRFSNWFYKNYGEGISQLFMNPYNKKIWCVNPNEMVSDFSFDPKLIPEIALEEMLDYTLLPEEERESAEKSIRYYCKGDGISELPKALAVKSNRVVYNKEVSSINSSNKTITFTDGDICNYKKIVSTIPLNRLVRYIDKVPDRIIDISKKLKYNSVYILNFALKRQVEFDNHWLYIPEQEYDFARIYSLSNFSKEMVPWGTSSISILKTYLPEESCNFNKANFEEQIIKMGFLNERDIDFTHEQFVEFGFTIPLLETGNIVKEIQGYLKPLDIYSIGRYGEWRYLGIEHAIMDGKNINQIIMGN